MRRDPRAALFSTRAPSFDRRGTRLPIFDSLVLVARALIFPDARSTARASERYVARPVDRCFFFSFDDKSCRKVVAPSIGFLIDRTLKVLSFEDVDA